MILIFLFKEKYWNDTFYFHDFDECGGNGDCLSYDINKLCSNYHVDINFYSGKLKMFIIMHF
jgi:hypothetical protein